MYISGDITGMKGFSLYGATKAAMLGKTFASVYMMMMMMFT
jgi:hypothetical protein